jgi:hypothetical protein
MSTNYDKYKKAPDCSEAFALHFQFCHEVVVGFRIFALEVLLVALQVLGELLDFLGEDGDLDLRGTGVCGVRLEFLNDALLFFRGQHGCVGDWLCRAILGGSGDAVSLRIRVPPSRNRAGRSD